MIKAVPPELQRREEGPSEFAVANVDQSLPKIIGLAAVPVILAFFFAFFFKRLIIAADWGYLWSVLIFGLFFLSFFVFGSIFIKSRKKSAFIISLECLALISGFYNRLSSTLIFGVGIAYLFFLLADYLASLELENMIYFKLTRVSRVILPKAILALAIFLGFAYYAEVSRIDWREPNKFFISYDVFEAALNPSEVFIKKIIPEFDLTLRVDDFFRKMAENQIERVKSTSGSKSFGEESASVALDLKKQVEDAFGVTLDSQKKLGRAIYDAALKRLRDLPDSVTQIVPFWAGVGVFLIILGFSWLFRLVATLLVFFIYELFLAVGFAVIVREYVTKETVILPMDKNAHYH